RGDRLVRQRRVERVETVLEPDHHADGTDGYLCRELQTFCAGLCHEIEQLSMTLWLMMLRGHRQRHRSARTGGERTEQSELGLDVVVDEVGGDLDEAATLPAKPVGATKKFAAAGVEAGDRVAVAGLVITRSRRRKAKRSRVERGCDDFRHLLDFVVGWLI